MWQDLQPQLPESVSLVAIALDPTGAEAARPYVEAAGATFPVLVDSAGASSLAFGFKAVPNGVLVDETGIIRYRRDGGFSIQDEVDRAAVLTFATGGNPPTAPPEPIDRYELPPLEREYIAAKMELGHLLSSLGRSEEAVAHWQAALRRDPDNLTIRKAIWAARFPERFHPTIDWDWQKAQLERERAEEIARGECGPDGCPLPWAGR